MKIERNTDAVFRSSRTEDRSGENLGGGGRREGKVGGRENCIDGCSCSFRYYRFLGTRRRQRLRLLRKTKDDAVRVCPRLYAALRGGPPLGGRQDEWNICRWSGPFSKHHHLAPYYRQPCTMYVRARARVCTIRVADIDRCAS